MLNANPEIRILEVVYIRGWLYCCIVITSTSNNDSKWEDESSKKINPSLYRISIFWINSSYSLVSLNTIESCEDLMGCDGSHIIVLGIKTASAIQSMVKSFTSKIHSWIPQEFLMDWASCFYCQAIQSSNAANKLLIRVEEKLVQLLKKTPSFFKRALISSILSTFLSGS